MLYNATHPITCIVSEEEGLSGLDLSPPLTSALLVREKAYPYATEDELNKGMYSLIHMCVYTEFIIHLMMCIVDWRRLVYAQQHACRKVLRETTGSALTLLRNTYK